MFYLKVIIPFVLGWLFLACQMLPYKIVPPSTPSIPFHIIDFQPVGHLSFLGVNSNILFMQQCSWMNTALCQSPSLLFSSFIHQNPIPNNVYLKNNTIFYLIPTTNPQYKKLQAINIDSGKSSPSSIDWIQSSLVKDQNNLYYIAHNNLYQIALTLPFSNPINLGPFSPNNNQFFNFHSHDLSWLYIGISSAGSGKKLYNFSLLMTPRYGSKPPQTKIISPALSLPPKILDAYSPWILAELQGKIYLLHTHPQIDFQNKIPLNIPAPISHLCLIPSINLQEYPYIVYLNKQYQLMRLSYPYQKPLLLLQLSWNIDWHLLYFESSSFPAEFP